MMIFINSNLDRLEFKASHKYIDRIERLIRIQTDWNLKETAMVQKVVYEEIRIQTDWNLKNNKCYVFDGRQTNSNLDRLEFKDG